MSSEVQAIFPICTCICWLFNKQKKKNGPVLWDSMKDFRGAGEGLFVDEDFQKFRRRDFTAGKNSERYVAAYTSISFYIKPASLPKKCIQGGKDDTELLTICRCTRFYTVCVCVLNDFTQTFNNNNMLQSVVQFFKPATETCARASVRALWETLDLQQVCLVVFFFFFFSFSFQPPSLSPSLLLFFFSFHFKTTR